MAIKVEGIDLAMIKIKELMKIILVLILIIIVIASLLKWGSYKMNHTRQNYLRRMMDKVATSSEKPVPIAISSLPDPIQRYLQYSLGHRSSELISLVRLYQEGEFKLKPNRHSNKGWLPITAEQYVNTMEPDFFWFARIKMNPLIWIKGWDYYINNQANMHWKFNSVFKIVDEKGRKLNQGSMTRYLAEIPWFPWAIIYNPQIIWKSLGDNLVQATLLNGDIKASVVFHINELGQITEVSADRYRIVNGRYELTPWTGNFENYQKINGVYLPITGEVKWHLLDRDYSYARLNIAALDFDPY